MEPTERRRRLDLEDIIIQLELRKRTHNPGIIGVEPNFCGCLSEVNAASGVRPTGPLDASP